MTRGSSVRVLAFCLAVILFGFGASAGDETLQRDKSDPRQSAEIDRMIKRLEEMRKKKEMQ